jgi:hypothetical protein
MPSLISKREKKRLLAGRNRERGRPGEYTISYCPMCPRMKSPSDPEKDEHVNVDLNTRTAKCRNGHEWKVI